tara:strand:- start:62 stop:496 length:435 start_codon:yes stop_codon:yes gene_type:complete
MSTLITNTIQSATSSPPVMKNSSGTEIGQFAKAWVNFDGTSGGTNKTIRSSFNISTVTDNGLGDYTINFTNAMPNANYVVCGNGGLGMITGTYNAWTSVYIHAQGGSPFRQDPTTTSFRIAMSRMGDAAYVQDYERVSLVVFGE